MYFIIDLIVICRMLFVMYGSMVYASVLADVERNETAMHEVLSLFLFNFVIGMMLDSFHMCCMILVVRASMHSCAG